MGTTGEGWFPGESQSPERLGLAVRGLGISSRTACSRLCDLGQVPSPKHVPASQSVKRGGGVRLGFQGSVRAASLVPPKGSCLPPNGGLPWFLDPSAEGFVGGLLVFSPREDFEVLNAGDDQPFTSLGSQSLSAHVAPDCRSENRFMPHIYSQSCPRFLHSCCGALGKKEGRFP